MATEGAPDVSASASDGHRKKCPPPLVVILGSTGVGKTKLSIELARRFDGEIISADSMQVYRGLDIVTAKATREEQAQARHHLLDVATPDQAFTVIHFREMALPIIDRLLEQNRMPIVVGGTNYYIESVLWQVLVGTGIREERTRRRTSSRVEPEDPATTKKKRPKLSSEESESATSEDDAKKVVGSENESGQGGKEEEGKKEEVKIAASGDEVEDEESLVARVLPMTTEQLEQLESGVLHRVLRRVDPVSADRLHPNNKRKIVRALEVFRQDGQPLSRILAEQRGQAGGSQLGGPLRYRNVVIFWLRCEQETLNARLNSRVDSMVSQGLLAEIRQFYEQYVKPYDDNDFHRGILQSIGFKEFVRYLERYDRDHDRLVEQAMMATGGEEPEGLALLRSCLDNLKLVTQRYSKKQLKWINHRFLAEGPREVPPIYPLDTTDVSRWDELVSGPAVRLIEALQATNNGGTDLSLATILAPLAKHVSPRAGLNEETSFHCDVCQRTIVGEYQWADHLRSNRHKKCLQSKHKKAKVDSV